MATKFSKCHSAGCCQ